MSSHTSDPVRPDNDTFEATFVHGYQTWSHLQNLVQEKGHCQVILQSLRAIDSAVPHFPELPGNLSTSSPVQGLALAKGTLTWDVMQGDDRLQRLNQDMRLQMALSSPVKVERVADDGTDSPLASNPTGNRHLAVLFAAWAYVLAARWSELLPNSAIMKYTPCEYSDSAHIETAFADENLTDLGDVDDFARQWWKRVLSVGSGWEARLLMDGQREMHSPWSISLDRMRGQKRRRNGTQPPNSAAPQAASFKDALSHLQDYVNYHHAYDQSRAALSAALFITVARHDQRDISLTRLRTFKMDEVQHDRPVAFTPTNVLLDRLLLLSSNAFGMEALLHSTFYEPGVFCNLSGAWTQGLLRNLKERDQCAQLAALTTRDPNIGFLWVGAYLTGAEEVCFKQISRGLRNIDLNVGALTGTSMSFAQEDVTLDAAASSLSKADECRMRYMYQSNLNAPNFAFPPFGTTAVGDLDLGIRNRLAGHSPLSMQLQSVTWETATLEGSTLPLAMAALRTKTQGTLETSITSPSPSAEERTAADECSKATTRAAFSWLRESPPVGDEVGASETSVMVEGGPSWTLGEREIFQHEWLRSLGLGLCLE